MSWEIESVATELLRCEEQRVDRPAFTDDWPELDLDTAYEIQDLTLQARLDRGETLVGVKLGLTSKAKQQRMGVDVPFVAWLTDAMILPMTDPVPLSDLIHPRVEPEIVFTMGERLVGAGVSCASAMSAVDSVRAGVEVIDSRYQNFRFKAGDVVADNASSALYTTGGISLPANGLDLLHEGVLVEVGGEVIDSATGAAVQGHPAEALALAAKELSKRGHAIEAGWVVLTGGMTDAVPLVDGAYVGMHFSNLGSIYVRGQAG